MFSFITITGKKSVAGLLLLLIIAGTLLFAACPDKKKEITGTSGNKSITAVNDSTVLINHLAFLTSATLAGRETATPGNLLAQQYIVRVMDSLKLLKTGESRLQPFPVGNEGKQGNNVIGYLKGTKYPDSYIVLTAHYDHLGTRNGQIYFGADDNASGTAALLTMAKYFATHPPQHSILFVAFDAEEKGLVGSNYFTAHPTIPLSALLVNINMDMIGRNDSNEIYICGTYHYPALKKFTDSIQPIPPIHVLLGHDNSAFGGLQDWTAQSDHYAFHKFKIPFLYFGVEDHPDYHRPSDTFDKIQKSFYYRVSNIILQTVLLLDRQQQLQ